MKKFVKFSCLLIIFISCSLFFIGCNNNDKFEHTTQYFNPEYNGNKYKFEITVLEVSNDYSSNIWSRGLDTTIQIKTKTIEDGLIGWRLQLYDFEFYLTKPFTIYETYMYLDKPEDKITEIVLMPQTTTTLHLRIDYDSSIFEEDVLNYYIIKLWNIRI